MNTKKIFAIIVLVIMFSVLATATVSASTVRGNWGCFEYPVVNGQMKGRLNGDDFIGKFVYRSQVAYLIATVSSGRFTGTAFFKGNAYPMIGNYNVHGGMITAWFVCLGYHGWLRANMA